jgi:hypothetical protein
VRIASSNLPAEVTREAQLDLDAVAAAARRAGKRLPEVALHLVDLGGALPSGVPAHRLRAAPRTAPPSAFRRRCQWEQRRQAYELIPAGDALWLLGGEAEGVLNGLNEALECLAGVIWAGPDPADTLLGPTRPLPVGPQAPDYPYRLRDGRGPEGVAEEDYLRWLSRARYSGRVYPSDHWAKLSADARAALTGLFAARRLRLVTGYHAMHHFLPESEFAAHPEWFGMRDGVRVRRGPVILPEAPHLNATLPIQPCYANPELVAAITDRMAAQIASSPEIAIFSIWPHDGVNNWCQCPACQATTPFEQMYGLALALAAKTPATLPLELIVYANMNTLPRRPLPRCERVIVMLCPYLRHYRHRVYTPGGPPLSLGTAYPAPDRINPVDDREYGTLFRAWAAAAHQAGAAMGIFEYGGTLWLDETFRTHRQRYLYHPAPALRFAEAGWYNRRGVRYAYLCAVCNCWPDGLHYLAFTRSLWAHREAPDAFAARLYAAIAGHAGPHLQAALAVVARCLDAQTSPLAAVAALRPVLAALPEPWHTRYHLWTRYVELAWASEAAERAGDVPGAIAAERALEAFLQEASPALTTVTQTPYLARYGTAHRARLEARQEQRQNTDYRL